MIAHMVYLQLFWKTPPLVNRFHNIAEINVTSAFGAFNLSMETEIIAGDVKSHITGIQ